jgi:hypothetical protein
VAKLLLGAGNSRNTDDRLQGYVTQDAVPGPGVDVVAVLPPLPETLRKPWDEIMIIHMIEHLYPDAAVQLIAECHEVLAPGGRLILEQPNLNFCMRVVLGDLVPPKGEALRFGLMGIFGEANGQPEMLHRWGYSPESLMAVLIAAGFAAEHIAVETVQFHYAQRDFRLVGMKA